jgi:integrase
MARKLQSGRWQARVRIDGKQVSVGTYPSEREALRAELNYEKPDPHAPKDVKAEPRLFRDWAEHVLLIKKNENVAPGTLVNQQRNLKNHALPFFGDKYLHEITRDDIERWYLGMPDRPGRSNVYRDLSNVFRYAVDRDLIPATPCRVKITIRKKKAPLLTLEELELLLKMMSTDMRELTVIMLGGALRIGEVLGLDRADMDLETGIIHVHQQLAYERGRGEYIRDELKNHEDKTVMLPQLALDAARSYVKRHPRFGREKAFFVHTDGHRLTRRRVFRDWDLARAESGLDWVTTKAMRHLSLTLLGQSGATVVELMEKAGHKTTDAMLTYQHASTERRDLLASRLNDAMKRRQRSA